MCRLVKGGVTAAMLLEGDFAIGQGSLDLTPRNTSMRPVWALGVLRVNPNSGRVNRFRPFPSYIV